MRKQKEGVGGGRVGDVDAELDVVWDSDRIAAHCRPEVGCIWLRWRRERAPNAPTRRKGSFSPTTIRFGLSFVRAQFLRLTCSPLLSALLVSLALITGRHPVVAILSRCCLSPNPTESQSRARCRGGKDAGENHSCKAIPRHRIYFEIGLLVRRPRKELRR